MASVTAEKLFIKFVSAVHMLQDLSLHLAVDLLNIQSVAEEVKLSKNK